MAISTSLLWQNFGLHISVKLFCLIQNPSAYIKNDNNLFTCRGTLIFTKDGCESKS